MVATHMFKIIDWPWIALGLDVAQYIRCQGDMPKDAADIFEEPRQLKNFLMIRTKYLCGTVEQIMKAPGMQRPDTDMILQVSQALLADDELLDKLCTLDALSAQKSFEETAAQATQLSFAMDLWIKTWVQIFSELSDGAKFDKVRADPDLYIRQICTNNDFELPLSMRPQPARSAPSVAP